MKTSITALASTLLTAKVDSAFISSDRFESNRAHLISVGSQYKNSGLLNNGKIKIIPQQTTPYIRHNDNIKSMRYTITNTHRVYPIGRDSREALAVLGWETLINSILSSIASNASNMDVNQGNIKEETHHLNEFVLKEQTSPLSNAQHNIFTAPDSLPHTISDLSKQISNAAHHSHHHSPRENNLNSDPLHAVSVTAGHNVFGEGSTPSLIFSGGLILAALSGATHAISALDHNAAIQLKHWPIAHHASEALNQQFISLLRHMKSLDSSGEIQQSIKEAIHFSSIETVLDPKESGSVKAVKLNIKPVQGGPTITLYLEIDQSDQNQHVVGISKKDFSVDLPFGSLTLSLLEDNSNDTSLNSSPQYILLPQKRYQPIILSFVEKSSNTEFVLARIKVPLLNTH